LVGWESMLTSRHDGVDKYRIAARSVPATSNFRSIRFSACMMLDLSAHRASRSGLWHGAFEGIATVTGLEVFDVEAMAARGRDLITEAYSRGNCVIVGLGGQCVLQHMKDVLHVFIYAPWRDRIARVQKRVAAAADIDRLIRMTDRQRADYIRMYFGCNWNDPHQYHMLISSEFGEDCVTRMIVDAIKRGDDHAPESSGVRQS